MEPADPYRMYDANQPVIIGMWHGQHFLLPFLRRNYRFKVLISRHTDGEINAIAAERLGIGAVRGSGDHGRRFQAKGGVAGFKEMIEFAGRWLEYGTDRRRSKNLTRFRDGHYQTGTDFRPADFSDIARDQPPDRSG